MRKTGRCILSAVIAVLLMIGAIDYAFVIGKAKPVGDLKTSQSEVIVKDFIHDNYEISEKNPWTDYGLHPIEYTESAGKSGFDKAISAKAAILVNVNSKEIYYELCQPGSVRRHDQEHPAPCKSGRRGVPH